MTDLILDYSNEIWKPVVGYEDLYHVSDMGRVFSLRTNKILKAGKCGKGKKYRFVGLCNNCHRKYPMVHRIVASAFIGISDLEVDHLNSDPSDNRLKNLEYVTSTENMDRCLERKGWSRKPSGKSH